MKKQLLSFAFAAIAFSSASAQMEYGNTAPDNVKFYNLDGMELPSYLAVHGVYVERQVKNGKIVVRKIAK